MTLLSIHLRSCLTKGKFLFILLFLSFVSQVHSQKNDKVEYEERINEDSIPKAALSFVHDNILSLYKSKPRWYIEINENGTYYECKLKVNKEFNSIKFDSIGEIFDIEIIVDLKNCAPQIFDSVQAVFKKDFKTYKIEKVQLQYSGPKDQLKTIFYPEYTGSNYTLMEGVKTRFEIEVKGKKNGKILSFEYLFDLNLGYISHRKIIRKTTDHLNY